MQSYQVTLDISGSPIDFNEASVNIQGNLERHVSDALFKSSLWLHYIVWYNHILHITIQWFSWMEDRPGIELTSDTP